MNDTHYRRREERENFFIR